MTPRRLFALVIEDNPADAELAAAELRHAGIEVEFRRVETEEDFLAALHPRPDFILADYSLPRFGAIQALQARPDDALDIPFLVFTGSRSDADAVEALKRGAVDYLLKDRLGRLPQAVLSAIEGARVRRAHEEALERLRESERRYRRLFLQDLAGIYVADAGGTLIDCNPTFARMFGFASEAEAIGTDVGRLYPPGRGREAFLRELGREGRVYLAERTFQTLSGEPVHVLESAVAEYDGDGRLAQVSGYVADISARRAAEERRDLLATAIEASGGGVLIVDAQGVVQYANRAFEVLGGISLEEAAGRDVRSVLEGPAEGEFLQALCAALQSGRPFTGRVAGRDPEGEPRYLEASISPVRDTESGTVTHFVAIQHDVTREARLDQQLREVEQMESLGRLAGGIAHDFNNLLTVIRAGVEFAQMAAAEGQPVEEDLREVESATRRAADLTRQLLSFGRVQTLRPIPVRLRDIVAGFLPMLQRVLREDTSLVVDTADDPWTVVADAREMERLLMNLVVNARDAMPEPGRVTISTAQVVAGPAGPLSGRGVPPGEYVRLEVADTGTGMDEATLSRVFEPFFTTKPEGRGTGLGLASVYGMVKQIGGQIWIESALGKGTRVVVMLPRAREAESEPAAGVAAGNADRRLDGVETVLVVADHDGVRRGVEATLRHLGYRVLTAAACDEALPLAEADAGPLSVVLCDAHLPKAGSEAFLARLRRRHPGVEVVFMRAHARGEAEPDLPAGAAYLSDPLAPGALAEQLRRTLGSRPARA